MRRRIVEDAEEDDMLDMLYGIALQLCEPPPSKVAEAG